MTPDRLPIVEIFHAPQGEGTLVGQPSTFVRLAGCNLRCTWCDTPYSWNAQGMRAASKLSMSDIAAQIRETHLVITGGEPMLHERRLPQLIAAARENGCAHVTIETNATIAPGDAWWDAVDLWSLSPKLPGSGEVADADMIARYVQEAHDRLQLKFVIADIAEDWKAMWQLLGDVSMLMEGGAAIEQLVPIIVQPDGLRDDYAAALRELTEHVMASEQRRSVRIVPQVHRIAYGVMVRGV